MIDWLNEWMNEWNYFLFKHKLENLLFFPQMLSRIKYIQHTYIYIYAFSRCFYPKRLTLHSSYSFTFDQLLLSLGIEPMILALLAPCSTIWATGKLKGTVHPKMKIVSSFLTLMSLQTCMSFFLMLNTKEDILKNQKVVDPEILRKSMGTINWLQTFFKTSYFVFNMRKKLIQVWNDMRTWNIIFGWTVPLTYDDSWYRFIII